MPSLSPREMEALRHISRGRTIDEIAHEMAVSPHTVRNFIRRIYQKMEVDTRVEAVQRAYRNGQSRYRLQRFTDMALAY
jgi:DNA-binding CsgD family transcriptional regulator